MGENKAVNKKTLVDPSRRDVPFHYLLSGTVFLVLWMVSQLLPAGKVFYYMDLAVDHMDSGYLLASAVVLVLINSTRAIFLYLGWFLLGEGVTGYTPGKAIPSWILPLVAIPLSYSFLQFFGKGITPHFGTPAVLSVTSVLVLHFMTREVSGWLNRSLALAMFIFSFQWLDVVPFLTRYGAGWGELSMAIKNIALLMEREVVLDISGITLFCSLFLGGMITSEFLVAYSSRIRNLYLLRENEKKMALLREENIRNRGAVELQQLVHDLKRPLTTITGLTDVILSLEDPSEMKSHTSVIRKAARNMNGMVSEILSGRSRRNVKVSDLIDYTRNQISPFEWKEQVRVDAEEEALKTEIQVNLIRLSRALVNLLDNSRRAVESCREPRINIEVVRDNHMVSVRIRDNGPGFGHGVPPRNYSGWNSTGIGLGFVEQVVEDNGGSVIIYDDAEGGGVVEIRLPVLI